jgi:hypothetical protein
MDELIDHYAHGIATSGFKSVEVCQGMLLLACFSKAAAAFENDRTWTTIGTVRSAHVNMEMLGHQLIAHDAQIIRIAIEVINLFFQP